MFASQAVLPLTAGDRHGIQSCQLEVFSPQRPLSQCDAVWQIFWSEVLNCPCHFKLCKKLESRLCTQPHLIKQHACEENQMLPQIGRGAGRHLSSFTGCQAARDESHCMLALWKEPSFYLQREPAPAAFLRAAWTHGCLGR